MSPPQPSSRRHSLRRRSSILDSARWTGASTSRTSRPWITGNAADSAPTSWCATASAPWSRGWAPICRSGLNAPVRRIDWSGDGVAVETPDGVLRARACVVTVFDRVLGAESIAITPDLPVWKQEAIQDVPMGLLLKSGLQFDGARFGLARDNWLTYWTPNDVPARAAYFLTWPSISI